MRGPGGGGGAQNSSGSGWSEKMLLLLLLARGVPRKEGPDPPGTCRRHRCLVRAGSLVFFRSMDPPPPPRFGPWPGSWEGKAKAKGAPTGRDGTGENKGNGGEGGGRARRGRGCCDQERASGKQGARRREGMGERPVQRQQRKKQRASTQFIQHLLELESSQEAERSCLRAFLGTVVLGGSQPLAVSSVPPTSVKGAGGQQLEREREETRRRTRREGRMEPERAGVVLGGDDSLRPVPNSACPFLSPLSPDQCPSPHTCLASNRGGKTRLPLPA